ncbi:MAG: hypothetical protein RMK57_12475 [Bryobacterales bacterium]|nr:hypothetical protein [Bryobacteraceae bacterium]MDW8355331.1 hypothetical protein [Bryobacterales bacterium]
MRLLVAACAVLSHAATFPIRLDRPAEVVAELHMRSPGADFAKPGREAAVATVSVSSKPAHAVVLFAGENLFPYRVFLGELPVGEHMVRVERDASRSAGGAGLEIASARFFPYRPGDADYRVVAHAPVVYARPDTLGRFSDVPLVLYCERFKEAGEEVLQYTILFSNEDGGTPTPALMARWGRTTDIEWVYRVHLTPDGRAGRAAIQTRDHKEVPFAGVREGSHPVLYVITENNMVGDSGPETLRYQLAPWLVDLRDGSRERVMDQEPLLYRVAAQELQREGKLRAFGKVEGEKIGDPRNYLYVEMKLDARDAAAAVRVRLQGERRWRSSHRGRLDYAIGRSGWVRTAVELPPGATPDRIAELGLECLLAPRRVNGTETWPQQGSCRLEQLGRVFWLDADYKPQPVTRRFSTELAAGELVTFDW